MRKSVGIFAEKMEKKLQTKDDELGGDGWLNSKTDINFLMNRIRDGFIELERAFKDCYAEGVASEAVDIAKFAMMISDRLRGRP